ncbi:15590_t:CDS:2, partial [Racocetra fulgida]
ESSSSEDDSDDLSEISFSRPRKNHHVDANDDNSEDKPVMEHYDPKLEKTLNTLTVLIKSKKRSSVNEVYVDIPPRKKVRGLYKKEMSESELVYSEQECLDALMSANSGDSMSDNDYEKFYLDDFIFYDISDNEDVLFEDFRSEFFDWITKHRQDDSIFKKWLSEVNGNTDFRSVVANNMHLIWHEAYNLGEDYSCLPFFTVVTPRVYKWFNDLFPELLQPLGIECIPLVYIQNEDEFREINYKSQWLFDNPLEEPNCFEQVTVDDITLKVGDAVEVVATDGSTDGHLDYSFFCRYQYSHETEDSFLSFHPGLLPKEDGLICGCKRPEPNYYEEFIEKYNVNDCILLMPLKGDILDLYTVCCIERFDLDRKSVWLRRFYRWSETFVKRPKAPINEVLYSEYVFEFNKFQHVVCLCHVEFVKYGKKIPVNLQHRGAGNHVVHWVVDLRMQASHTANGMFVCFHKYLIKCIQLKIFRIIYRAIDKYEAAIKTYRHNLQHDDIDILNQSVNNILSDAILGVPKARVPSK